MEPRRDGLRVLVTGTPGVGKTTLCGWLKKKLGAKVAGISDLVEKKKLYSRRCDVLDTLEYSPSRVRKYLKKNLKKEKDYIFDTHDPESVAFMEFDVIIVLSCDRYVLSERYAARGYSAAKVEENLEVEIMEVPYNDVVEYFGERYEKEGRVLRVCTTNGKTPKSAEEIFQELSNYPIWKKLFNKT